MPDSPIPTGPRQHPAVTALFILIFAPYILAFLIIWVVLSVVAVTLDWAMETR